jgi:hypothetical protein
MELKNFPYHGFQTEYVIHGVASYIFAVLAAQILEHPRPRGLLARPAADGDARL